MGQMPFDLFDVSLQGTQVQVRACWSVPWSRTQVFSILMKFEQMPDWMPRLDESVVLQRGEQYLYVRQVGRLLGISLAVDLEVRWVEPEWIEFAQVQGSFDSFEGRWELQERGDVPQGCRICYELRVVHPLIRMAAWVSPYIKAEIREQLEALDAYMRRVLRGT